MKAQQVRTVLRRWGQRVTLCRGGEPLQTRAFLQPVAEKREQDAEPMTALGSVDGRLWIYLGTECVEPDDRILWNGRAFRVRSSRPWYVGEELLYWWAALERAKEEAT